MDFPKFQTVKVESRRTRLGDDEPPDKRNAMSPQMHEEMIAALRALAEARRPRCSCSPARRELERRPGHPALFPRLDDKPVEKRRAILASQSGAGTSSRISPSPPSRWSTASATEPRSRRWSRATSRSPPKTPSLPVRDQLGILPAASSPSDARFVSYRDAKWYALTGEPFDGRPPAQMRLVNRAVPRAKLREETVKLAKMLLAKNPQSTSR